MDRPTQRYVIIFALILTGCLYGCAAYKACGFRGCASDAKITANVQTSINQHPELGPNPIGVQTMDHAVYLYGLVDMYWQRQLAESVALDTPGTAWVVNSIAINNRA